MSRWREQWKIHNHLQPSHSAQSGTNSTGTTRSLLEMQNLGFIPHLLNQIFIFTRSLGTCMQVRFEKHRSKVFLYQCMELWVEQMRGPETQSSDVPCMAIENCPSPLWVAAASSINWGSGWKGCCHKLLAQSFFQSQLCRTACVMRIEWHAYHTLGMLNECY